MTITRRSLLAGLGATLATPAWAPPGWTQAIGPQSDPWAQVDPYADPRNGFPAERRADGQAGQHRPGDGVFQRGPQRHLTQEEENAEILRTSKSYAGALDKEGGPVADARVQRAIQDFVSVFAKAADRSHLPWQSTVTNNASINAWAMAGGKLCFHAGIIAMCDHPGELAAIAAHEIGHVDCLHHALDLEMARALAEAESAGMLDLGKASAGTLVPGAGALGVNTTLDLLRAGFSRESEFEADEHSVGLMRRVGTDPSWSVLMMTKLARHGFEHGHHLINPLLPGHPPATERVKNLARLVALNKSPQDTTTLPGWEVLKAAFPTPAKWRNT